MTTYILNPTGWSEELTADDICKIYTQNELIINTINGDATGHISHDNVNMVVAIAYATSNAVLAKQVLGGEYTNIIDKRRNWGLFGAEVDRLATIRRINTCNCHSCIAIRQENGDWEGLVNCLDKIDEKYIPPMWQYLLRFESSSSMPIYCGISVSDKKYATIPKHWYKMLTLPDDSYCIVTQLLCELIKNSRLTLADALEAVRATASTTGQYILEALCRICPAIFNNKYFLTVTSLIPYDCHIYYGAIRKYQFIKCDDLLQHMMVDLRSAMPYYYCELPIPLANIIKRFKNYGLRRAGNITIILRR